MHMNMFVIVFALICCIYVALSDKYTIILKKNMSGLLDRLSVPSTTDPLKFASALNLLYNIFDSRDFSIECESLLAAGPLPVPGDFDISTVDVTNQFKSIRLIKLLVQLAFQAAY